jgi:hypothetical protein
METHYYLLFTNPNAVKTHIFLFEVSWGYVTEIINGKEVTEGLLTKYVHGTKSFLRSWCSIQLVKNYLPSPELEEALSFSHELFTGLYS